MPGSPPELSVPLNPQIQFNLKGRFFLSARKGHQTLFTGQEMATS